MTIVITSVCFKDVHIDCKSAKSYINSTQTRMTISSSILVTTTTSLCFCLGGILFVRYSRLLGAFTKWWENKLAKLRDRE